MADNRCSWCTGSDYFFYSDPTGIGKWFNFSVDCERLNRRMHNKTSNVDNIAAIVGGRNIGDEYFNHNDHINFRDLDLLP